MLLLSSFVLADDFYHQNSLLYMWDFNDERNILADIKTGTTAQKRGTVRWIPEKFSYHKSPVIHIHGNIDPKSSFTIPSRYLERDLTDWTLDFEVGIGTHNLDHTVRDMGKLMPFGQVLRWGDLRIVFYQDSAQAWKGMIRIIYQGQVKTIKEIHGFKYYYMAIRSEQNGISFWLDSYCTDYIEIPRSSVVGLPITFGGMGFAGRFDDIKLYNKRLKPWEITQNYWGNTLLVEPKSKITTTWSTIKLKH
jgi:hypothetical protein